MTGVRLVPFMEPPEDCLWGGGRVEAGEAEPEEVACTYAECTGFLPLSDL